MIRAAVPGDLPEVEDFLSRHAASSMFLRGNIARFGLTGGAHMHATVVHVAPASGPIAAIFGCTTGGMLLLQAPGAGAAAIPVWAATLRGRRIVGATGDAAQVAALLAHVALPGPAGFDQTEPLMALPLDRLPATEADLRPATAADVPLLEHWFAGYLADTGLAQPGQATPEAATRARAAVGGPVRLLWQGGQPVAMAAINAQAGADVQLGGVYVPPNLRRRGLGRAVTAAVLGAARQAGARRAFLFSNNDTATRAYAAVGFTTVGAYRILLVAA